ncbi:MAG: VWA domain-containing protein, partial [Hyphomicrobiales bacterium]
MAEEEKRKGELPAARRAAEVEAFLSQVKAMPSVKPASGRGRLIFALDATASREPTWDHACRLQGEMFEATAALGGLDVQLVFYRGFNECKASRWLTAAAQLHKAMRGVSCVGGSTQIARVLTHARKEARANKVNALVFVGDA